MQTLQVRTLFPLQSPEFIRAYELGRFWYFSGEVEGAVDEAYLVTNIEMLIARRCKGEDLQWHLGFLMGMLSGNCIAAS